VLETRGKHYKANVSRTISWIYAANGENGGIIHQDFKFGNFGPALDLWWVGRASVVCNPKNGQMACAAFGGGDVTCNIGSEKPIVLTLVEPATSLAFSKSGQFLAASGMNIMTVWDEETNTVVMRIGLNNFGFPGAAQMSFTDDDSRIIVADMSGVQVWDKATSSIVSTIVEGRGAYVNAILVVPNDSVVVCSNRWIRRYDFAGEIVATLAESGGRLCCLSADGGSLAVAGHREITVFDLNSNQPLRTIWFEGATALSLNSDGNQLAAGNSEGHVTLFDTATGHRCWDKNPPGRDRWPWTYPLMFFVGWCVLAWRLSCRSNTQSLTIS
jgi:WD40 repeat protein